MTARLLFGVSEGLEEESSKFITDWCGFLKRAEQ
jgi:hypothetical protein